MRPASAEKHKGRSTTLFHFIVTLHRNRPQKPDVGQRVGADIYEKRLLDACSWLSEILAKFHLVVKGKAMVDALGYVY